MEFVEDGQRKLSNGDGHVDQLKTPGASDRPHRRANPRRSHRQAGPSVRQPPPMAL